MASDATSHHHASDMQKMKQPIIWGNVIGIILFHLLAVYGLFTLPLSQIRWQTYLWGEKLPYCSVEFAKFTFA